MAFLALILAVGVSCRDGRMSDSPPGTSGGESSVRIGSWGGRGIGLEVTDGGASAEFDCAQGTIDEPLILDPEGRFDAAGTIVRDQPGPQSVLHPPVPEKARYTGQVTGDQMALTVVLSETEEKFGAFILDFGSAPRIIRCL